MVYRGFGSSKTYSFTNILEIFKIINLSIFDFIKTVFILSGYTQKTKFARSCMCNLQKNFKV